MSSALRTMAYIGAAILIFFGVLFIWGAFGSVTRLEWVCVGVISVGIGFGLIWFASRQSGSGATGTPNVTLNVDLPGNVQISQMKCQSCGGVLSSNDIQMMAGAPVVTCPYCRTTYQITEEPKW
jgi:hypothetical protein